MALLHRGAIFLPFSGLQISILILYISQKEMRKEKRYGIREICKGTGDGQLDGER